LRGKLFDANHAAEADSRVYEVHPEVSFCAMAGHPLAHPKKTWVGVMLRRRLLEDAGVCLPDDLGAAGDVPCVVLAVGARDRSTGEDWGAYTVDPAALRHGAGVEHETTDPEQAYARFANREPVGYREGWLPG